MRRRCFLAGALSLPFALRAAEAQSNAGRDWPNWRGPHFNGASDETGLPVKFSPKEGVKWATEMPGPSAATPIVWGDHVFVSSSDPKEQTLLAMALDRKTGQVKWQHVAGSGYRPAGRGNAIQLDEKSNYASPSPVTDGKRVVFFYGNGDMVAYTPDGQKLWARNIQQEYGDFCFGWTFSSSPQLYEGRLYHQQLQRDLAVSGRGKDGSPSFLLALDPATGKELWKVERRSPARMESREAFTTPIPFVHNGRKEIVLAGGNVLTGHDPATGKELWRWETWNPGNDHPTLRLVPSPVSGGGVIMACAPKGEPVYAIKAGQSGNISEGGLTWKSEERGPVTSDVPTPLFYKGRFYVVSDLKKNVSCVEPATGKVLWQTPLTGPSRVWASPAGADGKLYLLSLAGEVHVLDAEKGDILASNPMAENDNEMRSSVAIARGNLFIRTNTHLYCAGS
jgi:outer membrane protein assembly factor BamB